MSFRSILLGAITSAACAYAQITVATAQYNNLRAGANLAEKQLTTANVAPATFGKLFSRAVDSEVYAYPLIVPNVTIPQKGVHNVVYVASGNNTVYAFDADDPAQPAPLWMRNLGPSYNISAGDVQPNWGILGTPVIYNNVLYVVAMIGSKPENWNLALCALNIATGEDVYGPPAPILFSDEGRTIQATPYTIQRAGLLAANGQIYVGFANFGVRNSHEHRNQTGFIYSYSPTDIRKPTHTFQTVKQQGSCGNGRMWRGGDVWQAGRGLAADKEGNVYVANGDGFYDGIANFGGSLVKLGADLSVKDWFTPADWSFACQNDLDLGASGPILIPGLNYVIAGGKEGIVYVLNQAKLGKLENPAAPSSVTQFRATQGCGQQNCSQSLALAYWERTAGSMLFVWDTQDVLRAYTFHGPKLDTTASAVGSLKSPFIGGVTVSANGNMPGTGIVWAITSATTTEDSVGPGVLRAYDAANIAHELWNSDTNSKRDALGGFTKFSIPVVANGKVYVITESNQLQVYGLLP